jgi:hypothetical protein
MYRSRSKRKAKKLKLEKVTSIALKMSKILRNTVPKRTLFLDSDFFLSLSVDRRNKLNNPVKKEAKVIGDHQDLLVVRVSLEHQEPPDNLDQKEAKEIKGLREILGPEVLKVLLAHKELLEQRDQMEQQVLKVNHFSNFVNIHVTNTMTIRNV